MSTTDRASPAARGRQRAPRLLALRALGLGDLLTAVPALRALRRHFPHHRMVLAAPEQLADAALATGAVDRLLPTEATGRQVPTAVDWFGPAPDVAVDLHGNGPLSRRLLESTRPGRLLAYDPPPERAGAGPPWRPRQHERARWCRLVNWYGVSADPDDLLLSPPARASPSPGAVVLHPGADAASRRWPPERFAGVAAALHARGHQVVVTAGPGEEPLAHTVAARAGLPRSAVAGGRGGLRFAELAALVAEATAVIVGDTGVAHLASALATPSVVLFGPVSPRLWGPPPLPRHRALWHPDPWSAGDPSPGDPHGDRPDERLLRLTVPEVLSAFDALPTGQAQATRPRTVRAGSADRRLAHRPRRAATHPPTGRPR